MRFETVTYPFLATRRGAIMKAFAADLAARLGAATKPVFDPLRHDVRCLHVGDRAPADRRVTYCAPFEESSLLGRGKGEILVPLGNGEAGRHAVRAGLPVAHALGLPVVFYHTTWRDPRVASDDPAAHVCGTARDVLLAAESEAARLGIPHRTALAMAEDVVEGTLARALADRCVLLIVARGLNTGRGSYVDLWLEKSPIPVLAMGRDGGRL